MGDVLVVGIHSDGKSMNQQTALNRWNNYWSNDSI